MGRKGANSLKHLGARRPDEIDFFDFVLMTKEFGVYLCEPVSLYLPIRS